MEENQVDNDSLWFLILIPLLSLLRIILLRPLYLRALLAISCMLRPLLR
jgi:hypothetical protein